MNASMRKGIANAHCNLINVAMPTNAPQKKAFRTEVDLNANHMLSNKKKMLDVSAWSSGINTIAVG
jgi:hypothetical protein